VTAAAITVAVAGTRVWSADDAGRSRVTASRPDSGAESRTTASARVSGLHLWASQSRPRAGEVVAVVVENSSDQAELFGVVGQLTELDASGSTPGLATFCLVEWRCVGSVTTDQHAGVPLVGVDAPAHASSAPLLIQIDAPPGRYRLVLTSNLGATAATDIDLRPKIGVRPSALDDVATDGAQVRPAVRGIEAGEVTVAWFGTPAERGSLDPGAQVTVERWHDGLWISAATAVAGKTVDDGASTRLRLPALIEGAYRVVLDGPRGAHLKARFWVAARSGA
jgi:hypothetical protein